MSETLDQNIDETGIDPCEALIQETAQKSDDSKEQSRAPHSDEERLQGHWLLASLGKRVLRPGGLGLTRRMLHAAFPSSHDRIVEFGPGVGLTAQLLLDADPVSYTGVDPNPEGREKLDAVLAGRPRAPVVTADASDTGRHCRCLRHRSA